MAEEGTDGNPNHALNSEHSSYSWPIPHRDSRSPWYWSVLFHKNLNWSQRLTAKQDTGYGSFALPKTERPVSTRWEQMRENVFSSDFYLYHSTLHGENGKPSTHLSNLAHDSSEFRLRECFLMFVALLAIGVLAYSFLFERWTIIDSLYFTVVMLTTTGYGDIAPSTAGGKLFASLFALAGIVLLGMILGVVGSRLVEAEIAYTQTMQSKSSSVLERAFGKRSSRKRSKTETIECDKEAMAESHMRHLSSSLSDSDSACSSVPDQETHERRCRSSIHERIKEPSCLSRIFSHLPGFAPLLLGGLVMALLNHWKWYDAIYYCIVTATVRVNWMGCEIILSLFVRCTHLMILRILLKDHRVWGSNSKK
jgi:voltage-gated potassium channel